MECDIVNHMAGAWRSGKTVGREGKALGRDRGKENTMRKMRLNLRLFEGEGGGNGAGNGAGGGIAATPPGQATGGAGQEG